MNKRSTADPDYFSKGMEENKVKRLCCQRMFLGHVDMTDDLIQYSSVDTILDTNGTIFMRHVKVSRDVSCE